VTAIAPEAILSLMLVVCRIGCCFLLLPGISSERIPVQARLFLALAVSTAICPLVMSELPPLSRADGSGVMVYMVTESLTGLVLGFFVRIFFLALEFGAVAAANFAGFGSVFSHSLETSESTSPFAMIVTLPATALFFMLDQHVRMIELLQKSYAVFPPIRPFDIDPVLRTLGTTFALAFKLALQVSAPLLVFSLTVNVLLGVMNKMVPQIPAYYISTPFLLLGGLLVFYFLAAAMLLNFESTVADFISELARG
jgi:flagellar biosynthesis protein FliR